MTIDPVILRAMQAAGCTTEQIIAVVEAAAAKDDERRERQRANNRERQRRYREAHNADNALRALDDVTRVTNGDTGFLDKNPQTPKIKPSREVNNLPARETLDLPEGVSGDLWAQYRAMRQRIRKPLNPHAEQLALKRLRKFAEDGYPPGDIVEAAIAGSYQGLFPDKSQKNGRISKGSGHEWGSTVAAAESLIADLERADGPVFPGTGTTGSAH